MNRKQWRDHMWSQNSMDSVRARQASEQAKQKPRRQSATEIKEEGRKKMRPSSRDPGSVDRGLMERAAELGANRKGKAGFSQKTRALAIYRNLVRRQTAEKLRAERRLKQGR